MKIIIIGAGISGLSAAYELSRLKNTKVELYDMNSDGGGLAKSHKYKDGKYSEHSWRGFNKSYRNLFDILQNINYNNKVLYDNINTSKKITSKIIQYGYLSLVDKNVLNTLKLLYKFTKILCYGSFRSNEILSKTKFLDQFSFIQKETYLNIIDDLQHIGPDPDIISSKTVIDSEKLSTDWYHLGIPTQDGLIKPWINYLKSNNVKIKFKHKLTRVYIKNKNITNLIFNNQIQKKADYYIFAIPPYALYKLFTNVEVSNSLKKQIENLHHTGYHKELSFRLYFKEYIKLDTNHSLSDTDWGMVIIPLHEYWFKNTKLGNGIKSIISGTCIQGYKNSTFTKKNVFNTPLNDIKKEIKRQLNSNSRLNSIIQKFNSKNLSDYNYEIEIWKEWYNVPRNCKDKKCIGSDTNEIYWTNTYQTFPHKLDQTSEIKNLFFCGVHTKTTLDIATMEAASESGKLACKKLCKKAKVKNNIYHYEHVHSIILRAFHIIDNILYKLKLPNILDVLIILTIIALIQKYFLH